MQEKYRHDVDDTRPKRSRLAAVVLFRQRLDVVRIERWQ